MPDVDRTPTRVLLVEEDPEAHSRLEADLDGIPGGPFDLSWEGDLASAMQRISAGGVDAVLLDMHLPDAEGTIAVERMHSFAPEIPIVVLADLSDVDLALRSVQGGAQDYLVRDEVGPAAVARSIRYAIERSRLISALRGLSLVDGLTELYNLRGFLEFGEQHLNLARRTGRGATLVFVDLDRFRTINDTLGHHIGDRALRRTAELLRESFRRSDVIARMEADEFAILALEASEGDGEVFVQRLMNRVEEFNRQSRESYRITLTVGRSRFGAKSEETLEELMAEAKAEVTEEKEAKRRAVLQ